MQVTLTYQNTRLQRITFVGWQENRSRMARIDLDIVKGLGSCSVRPDPGGDNFRPEVSAKVFETVRGNPFTEAEEEKIKKLLAGYCIEPEIVNNDQCVECGGNGRCCDACCDERGIG